MLMRRAACFPVGSSIREATRAVYAWARVFTYRQARIQVRPELQFPDTDTDGIEFSSPCATTAARVRR